MVLVRIGIIYWIYLETMTICPFDFILSGEILFRKKGLSLY